MTGKMGTRGEQTVNWARAVRLRGAALCGVRLCGVRLCGRGAMLCGGREKGGVAV